MTGTGVVRGGVPRPLLRSLALWYGVVGAPIVWLVRISVASALVPYACDSGAVWTLHAATAAALAVAAAAAVIAWRGWRCWQASEEGRPGTRSHLVALSGVLLSTLFMAAIVLEGLAPLFMDPCQ